MNDMDNLAFHIKEFFEDIDQKNRFLGRIDKPFSKSLENFYFYLKNETYNYD